jgi:hypothetical protein
MGSLAASVFFDLAVYLRTKKTWFLHGNHWLVHILVKWRMYPDISQSKNITNKGLSVQNIGNTP